jgi:transposase
VCFMSRSGSGKAGGPRPARRSWTARASRRPSGGRHGDDGAKKVNGRKRHLLVDTLGLVCKVQVTAADVGDRDGAAQLLSELDRRRVPRLRHGWADGGYRGPFLDWAHKRRGITFQVVQRHDGGRQRRWLPPGATPPIVSPFTVVPRRWVVERTFAWLGRYRRLSKDYEYLTTTWEAVIYLAMTRLLLRRSPAHELSDTLYRVLGVGLIWCDAVEAAQRYVGRWQTASMLLPSGSRMKAP